VPLPRYASLDPVKRRSLLEVAVARFAEKGYEGASLNEILGEAGLGKSSYYYYFADKEDLFATVLEDFWARIEPELPDLSLDAIDAETYWSRLEAALAAIANVAARHPHLVALGRDFRTLWRSPSPRVKPLVEKVVARQRALLELGRTLGTVRTDIDVDWLLTITEAADQAVDERILERAANGRVPSRRELDEHARVVADTFRRLVEPAPKRRGRP
jgi:AcrR family transcriptional regulator